MSGMLFLLFVQSLFQFGAKEGKWEGSYGEKNYLDTSFEAIYSEDVGGVRFGARTDALQEILYFRPFNFWHVVPMKMILMFLESQCNDLPKMYIFTTLWWIGFEL